MQDFKKPQNTERTSSTRESSKKTILSRVGSNIPSMTPMPQLNTNSTAKSFKPSQICIKISQKKSGSPIPQSEPPYLLMRNGIPFLYTPSKNPEYHSKLISPFATPLRGLRIKGRSDFGNMFAIHSGSISDRTRPFMIRSYLNMRSKWR